MTTATIPRRPPKRLKPIEKRCLDCGDQWSYGPTRRKCSLCGIGRLVVEKEKKPC